MKFTYLIEYVYGHGGEGELLIEASDIEDAIVKAKKKITRVRYGYDIVRVEQRDDLNPANVTGESTDV